MDPRNSAPPHSPRRYSGPTAFRPLLARLAAAAFPLLFVLSLYASAPALATSVLSTAPARSPAPALAPDSVIPAALLSQGTGPRFRHLTPDSGLSQSAITGIAQDAQGFMWFATQDGLNRYDGDQFKVFKHDPADPNTLATSGTLSLTSDPSGSLWIGTAGGGLDRYDPATGRFTHYQADGNNVETLSGNALLSLHVGRDARVWAGTTNNGLNVLDPKTGKVKRYPLDPADASSTGSNSVSGIWEDLSGAIWTTSFGGGLSRLDPAMGKFSRFRHDAQDAASISSDNLQTVYEDREGTLWVGTVDAGLDRYDPVTGKFSHYPPQGNSRTALGHPWVYMLMEDSRGGFWVGTHGGGLYLLDRATGRFTPFRHDRNNPDSIGLDDIVGGYEDRSGVLWFGTFGAGLDYYDPNKDKFLTLRSRTDGQPGLSNSQVWSVYEDPGEALWIGTNAGGLNRFDYRTGEWRAYRSNPSDPQTLSSDFVFRIYRDRAGTLWLGTNGGLSRFDDKTGRFERIPAATTVIDILEDHTGAFWLATGEGLILLDRATGALTRFVRDPSDPDTLWSDTVVALAEDNQGNVWVGTQGGALNRFDRATKHFIHYNPDNANPASLSDWVITSIFPAPDGTVWVGTPSGLNRLDPATGKAAIYRAKDGLPNDFVYCIQQDGHGDLWLSTNRGLARFNPTTAQIKTYVKSDGLQDFEFNQGACLKNREGALFFGGINGLSIFDPGAIQDNSFTAPIVITGLRVYRRSVQPGAGAPLAQPIETSREVRLAYDEGFFELQFSSLHYSAPEAAQFAYRLEGLDPDWNYVGSRRYATYTNVPPGDYTFRVKGTNADGVWNEQGAALRIIIPPPFWETVWFRVLVLVLVAGSITGAVGYRIRSIERQRKELERQVKERTSELREANAELGRAKDAAEAASRAKSAFLANMSHEFRTPLNAVLGFVGVLTRDERLHSDQRDQLEIVRRSGEHLLGLINDVLEISKIEAGRVVLNPRNFDLHRMLKGLAEMFALRAQTRGIVLSSEIGPKVPQYISGDEGKLRQVLMNLLGNAVKFTPQGQVLLCVETVSPPAEPAPAKPDLTPRADLTPPAPPVRLPLGDSRLPKREGGEALSPLAWISFEVRDTGAGIAPEEMDKLFEPFVQTASGEQVQEGTGLGLAISQQYVRAMGGEIRVQSEKGKGSTFRFVLPFTVVSATELERPPVTRRVVGLEPGQPAYRMLAVDDQEVNRKLLRSLLGPLGFEVREAANGREALEIWQEWLPQLIWMDMRMPVMDGYEATRRIKSTTRGQATVIVALTASALEEDRSVILSEGCDDYLRKPFQEQELLDVIAKHLGVRYVYRDLAEAEGGEPIETAAAPADQADGGMLERLRAMDADWLERLERASLLGDVGAIERLADAAAGRDPVLAASVSRLAARFDHARLLSSVRELRDRQQNGKSRNEVQSE